METRQTVHIIAHSIPSSSQASISTNLTASSSSSGNIVTDESNSGNLNESDLFDARLAEISEQMTVTGMTQSSLLAGLSIQSAVVSDRHMAFLLDNGRVCRIAYKYKMVSNSLSPNDSNSSHTASNVPVPSSSRASKHSKISSASSGVTTSLNVASQSSSLSSSSVASRTGPSSYRTQGSTRIIQTPFTSSGVSAAGSGTMSLRGSAGESFIIPTQQDILTPMGNASSTGSSAVATNSSSSSAANASTSSSLSHAFSRGRRSSQLLRGRVSNLIVGTRIPPFVPASAVPESLIESVQTVLQSKSRSVIVRELQRTVRKLNYRIKNKNCFEKFQIAIKNIH
jgi:trimeric autotransporter adhesin